ncbi:unnamed protein product [Meganyctiphanes norvegica]|uniref:Uncharacterized protein n=1 Tax=Meganyctiphanes norvegica TaxID=48144 RepID=A0AAV2QKH7_MEGNR
MTAVNLLNTKGRYVAFQTYFLYWHGYISRQLRQNHGSYNLWLALWASKSILTGPTEQLNIFRQPSAAHRYLAGPLGQLKIIGRPKAANIQFYYIGFEKPYTTALRLRGH